MRKYDEIMEKIVVTPEMKERVLGKVDAGIEKKEEKGCFQKEMNENTIYSFTEKTKEFGEDKSKQNRMKKHSFRSAYKYMTAACLVIAAAAVWTISRPYLPGSSGRPGQMGVPGMSKETDAVQIPNPLEEVSSIKKLSDLVGFEVKELPNLPFAVQQVSYISISRDLAEIIYTGADQELTYRKSEGTEDNSGNYTVYKEEMKRTIAGYEVTVKGDDGRCGLAIWTDGTYSYSIQLREGESISYEELEAMIENN